jgi:hypothetical protein
MITIRGRSRKPPSKRTACAPIRSDRAYQDERKNVQELSCAPRQFVVYFFPLEE